MLTPTVVTDRVEWDRTVAVLPGGHLLQSWDWGQLKGRHGWSAERLAWYDSHKQPAACVQILTRSVILPGGVGRLCVRYSPRGPCLDWSDGDLSKQVLDALQARSVERGTVFVKVDPETPDSPQPLAPSPDPASSSAESIQRILRASGWRPSSEQVQFRNTMVLDLRASEDQLLAGMKQKTRYNLRLAERRGVVVRPAGLEDLDQLYRMYAETSLRDGFVIRDRAYYNDAWGTFLNNGQAQPFLAEVEGQAVAGLMVFRLGRRAWYLYGMSRELHRELMPTYLLQWEAIRWARREGCEAYDFWGAPDRLDPQDPLWGVYRFKEGFGSRLVSGVGAWDFTVRPRLYWFYTAVLPRVLGLMRLRGRAQTRRAVD